MKSTKQQRSYIYKLASYNEDLKEELVQWATDDNSKISTHDLTFEQANTIIKKMGGHPLRIDSSNWGRFDKSNPQHKKILSLCQQYGWQKTNSKTGYTIADVDRLGSWLQKDVKCPVKKPLKDMDMAECTTIINALTIMVRKKYK